MKNMKKGSQREIKKGQELVEIVFLKVEGEDAKQLVPEGTKKHVGHNLAATLVKQKQAKILQRR